MRKPTRPKTPSQTHLDYHALERENLRLQREIAKVKAQLVSTRSELALRPPATQPIEPVTAEYVARLFTLAHEPAKK